MRAPAYLVPTVFYYSVVIVLTKVSDRQKLILTKAVLIKNESPALNSQEEGADRILNIFKH